MVEMCSVAAHCCKMFIPTWIIDDTELNLAFDNQPNGNSIAGKVVHIVGGAIQGIDDPKWSITLKELLLLLLRGLFAEEAMLRKRTQQYFTNDRLGCMVSIGDEIKPPLLTDSELRTPLQKHLAPGPGSPFRDG